MERTVAKTASRVKRPPNPFFIFSNENRTKLSHENPGLGNRDISRLLGILWSQLESTQKQDYLKRAALIRKQHLKDNPGYKFDPWAAKRKAKPQVVKNSGIKSASNVIILRALEEPKATLIPFPTSDCSEIPALKAPEEPIDEEKLMFAKLLGLCRKDSDEYCNIQTKLALKALNRQMFGTFKAPSLRVRRKAFGLAKPKPQVTDQVKRSRGRPRKQVFTRVAVKPSDQSIVCNSGEDLMVSYEKQQFFTAV